MSRCARCFLHLSRCLCARIPCVVTATELVIVRHELERWKNSNTARLAAMALPRSRLIDHPGPTPSLPEGTWLLYPGPEAAPPIAPPRCLVVLDGSWGQTRRMTQRLPWLRGLPRLSLPAPLDKLPRLRAQREEDGMSTLEAILRAVALLEGQAMADPLAGLLRIACQRHSMQPIADAI